MAKTKVLISCAVTAPLIFVFVFAYAKSWFSHNEAQISFQGNVLRSVFFICSTFKLTGIGVYNGRAKTKQGFDLIFGTNHLGTFLLTHLLIDLLKTSAPSHIINLTSAAHYFVWRNPFKDGELKTFAYPGSKVANIMHVRELSKRYKGTCIFKTLV